MEKMGITLAEIASLFDSKLDVLNTQIANGMTKIESSLSNVNSNVGLVEERLQENFSHLEEQVESQIQEVQGRLCKLESKLDENVKELQYELRENTGKVRAELHENMQRLDAKLNSIVQEMSEFRSQCVKSSEYLETRLNNLGKIVEVVAKESSVTSELAHECKVHNQGQDAKIEQLQVDVQGCQDKFLKNLQEVRTQVNEEINSVSNIMKTKLESETSELRDSLGNVVMDLEEIMKRLDNIEAKLYWYCSSGKQEVEVNNDMSKTSTQRPVKSVNVENNEEKVSFKPLQLSDVKNLRTFSGSLDITTTASEFLEHFEMEMRLLHVAPSEYLIALKYTLTNGALTWFKLNVKEFQTYSEFKVRFLDHFNEAGLIAAKLAVLRTQVYNAASGMPVSDFIASRFEQILALSPKEDENILVSQLFSLMPFRFQNVLVGRVFSNFQNFLCGIRNVESFFAQNVNQERNMGNRRNNFYENVQQDYRRPRVNRVQYNRGFDNRRGGYYSENNAHRNERSRVGSQQNRGTDSSVNMSAFNTPPPGFSGNSQRLASNSNNRSVRNST